MKCWNNWELEKQLRMLKFLFNSLKLFVIKPSDMKWIDLYNTLKDDKEMAKNGFRSARITEATENAKDLVGKVENPFKEVCL